MARIPPALVAARPPTVALSRAAKSTPASRPAARALSCTRASVTPAPAVTCAEARSTGPSSVRRAVLSTTSPPRGTPAPTMPVLPPWGTTGAPWARQAASTGATSWAAAGRPPAGGRAPAGGGGPRRGSAPSSRTRRGRGRRRRRGPGARRPPPRGPRADRRSHVACYRPAADDRRRAMSAGREHETIFTLEATPIKFGPGAAADAGWELKRLGVKRALLVPDPGVAAIGHPERIRASIEAEGIEVVVYDRPRVEPTLHSFQEAADFARDAQVDGFVSVGGGSSIHTAKVADLIPTPPAPVMDYVNPPVGEGRKPPSPLRPHLAIP